MDIFDAIAKRRSVRKFHADRAVDEAAVKKILEAGLLAPTAGNGQAWRFFVVRDRELKRKLALEAGHQKFIDEAPVAIVVCSDLDEAEHHYGERGRKTYALQETAAAIENMMLAAVALGFGTCWIGAFDEAQAAKILELPKNLRTLAIIPIGVPDVPELRTPPRKKMEDVVVFR
ncbi:MAG: nitroreductase family protein [Pseudomonadota bacterium]